MTAPISKKVLSMSSSATLAMTKRSRELQAKGIDVINLSIGEPDFDTPDYIKEAAVKAIEENFTHYPPVPGYLDLREAICLKLKRDNGLEFKPEQITVSNGAKHSITNVLMALLDDGDEVIIPAPFWVSYLEMVKFIGGVPKIVYAFIIDDFKITPQQLEAAITDKTKLIMFNNPSNPTGMVYTKMELQQLAEVLKRYPHVYILSDEIYELITFESEFESLTQFEYLRDRIVIVNGVSKGFAMTGWRIGYTAAPLEIASACNKIQGQMTSAASSIAQKAAKVALLQDPKESVDLKRMLTKFRERRDYLIGALKDIQGFKVNHPTGAFYIFANISGLLGKKYGKYLINTGDDLANYLLDEAHVALVGGDSFGNKKCIRISYATNTIKLVESVKRIKEAIQKLQ